MVFSTPPFLLLFLSALLLIYYIIPAKQRTIRNNVLLLFSVLFYAYGEPLFNFVMVFSIVLNWLLAIWIEKYPEKKKKFLVFAIVFDVLLLFTFKYTQNIGRKFRFLPLPLRQIMASVPLPIGISFFTFQLMSYIFDVYYGIVHAQKKLASIALYITLFPQLVAGPIVRYRDIESELTERHETYADVMSGLRRFTYGLGKKVLLADYLGQITDGIFSVSEPLSMASAWIGAIAFSLQIYFDFSGYSDMAIGLGRMFGFHFPENFNYPYIAENFSQFWRRWHISLSTWFRDYVYIPLGGSKCGKLCRIRNLFIVWLLTGIWHGANLKFIIWGLAWFAAISIEKKAGADRKNSIPGHIITLIFTILTWTVFRSDNITFAGKYLGYLFGIGINGLSDPLSGQIGVQSLLMIIAGSIAATPLFSCLSRKLTDHGQGWLEAIWQICIFFYALRIVLRLFILHLFISISERTLRRVCVNEKTQ